MKSCRNIGLGVLTTLTVACSVVQAQLPGAAAGGAAGATGGLGGAAVPTSAAAPSSGSNLWSFLLPNAQQKQNLKNCWCNSPLGQMMAGAAGPIGAMSGGLIPSCCAQNQLANNLLKPADSPDGLAAQIKKDEADAKERRAAVRYLGTVDCNYWPEAIDVLKKSLRGDRNECVRFEAALALQSGCCCKEEIIIALTNCVMGPAAPEDGFPKEMSPRVRAAAADALSHCVGAQPPLEPSEPAPPPRRLEKTQLPQKPDTSYAKAAEPSRNEVVARAREVLQGRIPSATGANPATVKRPGSLADVFDNAFYTPGTGTTTPKAMGTPGAPTAGPATMAGKREPFFANVTRALKGRETTAISVHRPLSGWSVSGNRAGVAARPVAVRTPPNGTDKRASLTFDDVPTGDQRVGNSLSPRHQ